MRDDAVSNETKQIVIINTKFNLQHKMSINNQIKINALNELHCNSIVIPLYSF